MATYLRGIGIVMIVCGLIGGIYLIATADWNTYKIAKAVAGELSANPYAQSNLSIAQARITTHLSMGLACLFSGIISGILFFSAGAVIDLLERIAINQEHYYRNWAQKAKASSTVCSSEDSN